MNCEKVIFSFLKSRIILFSETRMNQGPFLGTGWTRGGASEVVRRAHPASGAQWNVQVVRGKVNGRCLWNACKALSLGLLLMVLGAAMATIGKT